MRNHQDQTANFIGPSWEHEVELVKVEPARNCHRWYRVSLRPDLFDQVVLVREWGRLGNRGTGQRRVEPFNNLVAARKAMKAAVAGKVKRGYGVG